MNENLDIFTRLKKLIDRMDSSENHDFPEEMLGEIIVELNNIITEYKPEKKEANNATNLRKLIENHEGLVWVKDTQGRFIAVNKIFAHYYGVTDPEFFTGKTDIDLYSIDNEHIETFKLHDLRLLTTQIPFSIEEKLVLPERTIVTQAFKSPYYDENGNLAGTIGYLRDITKIKQLELQNRKLLKAIEQSTATIVITDIKGTIEYVNPQFTKLTGYTFDEAIGLNPRILKTNATSIDFYKDLWETILSGKEWRGEFCNRKKNGEIFWESAVISPVFDYDGSIINFIAVKDDITKIKEKEAELFRMSNMQDLLTSISIENII